MRIHRIATLGNSVAVILILMAAAVDGPSLTVRRPSGSAATEFAAPASARSPQPARRLILVVVDGLRADTAFDARLMPSLHRLATRGGRATARVEGLVPSTIAGIIAMVSGEVPPPSSSLSDFGAASRPEGGVLEAVTRSGGRTFVAGPRLWTDLYGRWITSAEVDPTFGGADERLVRAAMRALGSGAYRLIVLHLGRVDGAAHRHGTRSSEYRATVRRCDEVLGRLAGAMGPDTGLVVTSDHGNTDLGGHAGPEPSVLTTPMIMFGPGLPAGPRPGVPQRAVPSLLLGALGFDATGAGPSAARHEDDRIPIAQPLVAAMLCALRLWSGLRGAASGRRQATVLNLAVWLLLAMMALGRSPAALAFGLAVLAWAAGSVPGRIPVGLVLAVGSGAVLGALRLADGSIALDRAASSGAVLSRIGMAAVACGSLRLAALPQRPAIAPGEWLVMSMGAAAAVVLGQARLLLVYLAAVVLGRVIGLGLSPRPAGAAAAHAPSPARCLTLGVLTAAALVLLVRAAGGTTSLSTVDVRSAFGLVEWRCGLILAITAVAAAQSLPAIGLLLGLREALDRLSPDATTDLAGGLAAAIVGQAAAGALRLASDPGQPAAALALGLSVRVIGEALYLFLGLAALVLASGPRPGAPVRLPMKRLSP